LARPYATWFLDATAALGLSTESARNELVEDMAAMVELTNLDGGAWAGGAVAGVEELLRSNSAAPEELLYAALDRRDYGDTKRFGEHFDGKRLHAAYYRFGARAPDVVALRGIARSVGLLDPDGQPTWQPLAALALATGQLKLPPLAGRVDTAAMTRLAVAFRDAGERPDLAYLAALGMQLPTVAPDSTEVDVAVALNTLADEEQAAILRLRQNGNFYAASMAEVGYVFFDSLAQFTIVESELLERFATRADIVPGTLRGPSSASCQPNSLCLEVIIDEVEHVCITDQFTSQTTLTATCEDNTVFPPSSYRCVSLATGYWCATDLFPTNLVDHHLRTIDAEAYVCNLSWCWLIEDDEYPVRGRYQPPDAVCLTEPLALRAPPCGMF
jgi:hypothetical protein